MTFGFGFCSVLSGYGSVLGKIWVLVLFVLVGVVFFPSLVTVRGDSRLIIHDECVRTHCGRSTVT